MSATANDGDDEVTATVQQVIANTQEGEVGQRGEAFVAAQATILLCVLGGGVPYLGSTLNFVAGPLAMAAGAALIAAAVYELRGSLSPWVVPAASASLKTNGVYEFIRHPIYTGLLLLCFGFGVATNSAGRLILTAALLYILEEKASEEEANLVKQFPEYETYKEEVPGMFLPPLTPLRDVLQKSRS